MYGNLRACADLKCATETPRVVRIRFDEQLLRKVHVDLFFFFF